MRRRWCLLAIVTVAATGCGDSNAVEMTAAPPTTAADDADASAEVVEDSVTTTTEPISTISDHSIAPGGSQLGSTESIAPPPSVDAPNAIPSGPCQSDQFPSLGAFSVDDGAVAWALCSDEQVYRTIVAVSDSIVLVAEGTRYDDNHIVAYDPGGGGERWRLPVSSRMGLSLPDQGDIDVVAFQVGPPEAFYVAGVELSSGTERWATEHGLQLIAQSDEVVVLARPTTIENNIPLGGVIGVDRETGEQLWVNDEVMYQVTSLDLGIGTSGAALAGDVLTVPAFDIEASPPGDVLKGIDIGTGAVRWTAASLPRAIASDGVILGIPVHASVRAVSAADGATLWTSTGDEPYGVPLAAGDGLLVVTDTATDGSRNLVGYELSTGETRWRVPIQQLYVHAVTDSTAVLLWDTELMAISTNDGSTHWSQSSPLETPFMNNALANANTVFVAVNSLPWND